MTYSSIPGTVLGLAAALAATTARAEVTAAEVWENWKANFGLYGADALSVGSEEMSGDTLTVRDFALSTADEQSTLDVAIDTITFTEQGDGTVAVSMSETVPIRVTAPDSDGMAQEVRMQLSQSGLAMIVSGTPEEMDYAISAERYALSVEEVALEGTILPTEMLFAMNDLSGSYVSRAGEMREIEYDIAAASVDILVDVTDPEGGAEFDLSGKIEDVATQASVTMPEGLAGADPETLFDEGLSIEGTYTTGTSGYIFSLLQDGGTLEGTATSADGRMDFAVARDAMRYEAGTTDVALGLAGSTLPFPVQLSLAEYGVTVETPLGPTEEPADFAFVLNLSELAIDEMIWGMLDPQAVLPRDPLSVLVDLAGKMRITQDMLDPAQADAPVVGEAPAELHELQLNALEVSGLGARVEGEGAFTFDNADLQTFDGMPRPEGSATFVITGVNALMERLVQMGLVPQDQVMGARMMLGLFATPTGEDELTSTIEVNEEGHLLANGQRLQ